MTIQAILIPRDSSAPPITIGITESASPHLALGLQSSTTGAYFPVYTPSTGSSIEIGEVHVIYTGASAVNFVLQGSPPDDHKMAIEGLQHIASTSMTSQVWWSYVGNTIEWVFEDPPAVDTWVSWEFNPSGTTPPVRVKVVLKRQS